MKTTIIAVLAFLVANSFGLEKKKSAAAEYRAKALDSVNCLFAVFDRLEEQKEPASLEVATSMITWINTVSDSLAHNNLNFRITTEEVTAMRRQRVIEYNKVRKEDGLDEEDDWFPVFLESIKAVQDEYREKVWARPNLGWLTPFRRLSEVMQAEAHWQNVNLSEAELRNRKGDLKNLLSLLEAVKAVRVQYEKRGHRPGSIAWVEDVLDIKMMTRIPTMKTIEAKQALITRIMSEKTPSKLLKPFRPKTDEVKKGDKKPETPQKEPPAAPKRSESNGPTLMAKL